MPAPGTITRLLNPTGPGVRIDSGVEQGDVISGNFDSMLSKLIITGATRAQALQRARRALEEMVVEGIPTVIPFDLAVVTNPDFAPAEGPFKVHTRWIETAFVNDIPAWTPTGTEVEAADDGERQRVVVEVGGKRLEVVLPASLGSLAGPGGGRGAKPAKAKKRSRTGGAAVAASGNALTSPMQGTIVKVAVDEGDTVAEGDLVVVLEAMKMEQPLTAHRAGIVTGLSAAAGATVAAGAVIALIEDIAAE
jgi:acetyl-CoA/propionyl-CoA carboxylase biotin carboxyl carrier protein